MKFGDSCGFERRQEWQVVNCPLVDCYEQFLHVQRIKWRHMGGGDHYLASGSTVLTWFIFISYSMQNYGKNRIIIIKEDWFRQLLLWIWLCPIEGALFWQKFNNIFHQIPTKVRNISREVKCTDAPPTHIWNRYVQPPQVVIFCSYGSCLTQLTRTGSCLFSDRDVKPLLS